MLACTHFPLLSEELTAALGQDMCLVDGAQGIAARIATLVGDQPFMRSQPDLAIFTGGINHRPFFAEMLARYGLERIEPL